jgi:hypothetical protein
MAPQFRKQAAGAFNVTEPGAVGFYIVESHTRIIKLIEDCGKPFRVQKRLSSAYVKGTAA